MSRPDLGASLGPACVVREVADDRATAPLERDQLYRLIRALSDGIAPVLDSAAAISSSAMG